MFLVSNQRGQVLWSAKYSSFRVSSVQVRVAFSSADSNLAKGQFPCSVGKGRKTLICSAATLFSRLLFVLLFRLEDISLANSKLQQSLKVKEEKITELESQYVAKLVKKKRTVGGLYRLIIQCRITQVCTSFDWLGNLIKRISVVFWWLAIPSA